MLKMCMLSGYIERWVLYSDSIRKNYYATLQEDAINMVLKL